jgi:hypothetical protein
MITEKIGIGIIDVYGQVELDNCINSIPSELKESVFVVSNTKNTLPKNGERYDKEISFGSLKNRVISHFRIKQKQFLFLINSNYAILNPDFFDKTVKKAFNFGTWMMTGPGDNTLIIDDDEKNLSLEMTPELNADVIFLYSNIVKRYGYFNEQYFSNNQLETLDYILKLRKDGIYPVEHFNPSMKEGLYKSAVKLNKIISKDQRATELSFGLFYHRNKYIPGQNDVVGATADQMFTDMERIQKNYARVL